MESKLSFIGLFTYLGDCVCAILNLFSKLHFLRGGLTTLKGLENTWSLSVDSFFLAVATSPVPVVARRLAFWLYSVQSNLCMHFLAKVTSVSYNRILRTATGESTIAKETMGKNTPSVYRPHTILCISPCTKWRFVALCGRRRVAKQDSRCGSTSYISVWHTMNTVLFIEPESIF